jgi:dihydrodipicolinate synthase/N-acetylneuraminate lyase
MTTPITGIVPILVTPFDETGRLDTESLARLVDFNIECGVHGLGIAIGSELFKLTDEERDAVISIVVKAARGRTPIVVNTGAGGTDVAVDYTRRAAALGADAAMVIPPFFMPVGQEEIVDYYRAVSAAASIPLFMQDVPQAPISPALALRIAAECENVKYIKVETLPVVLKVGAMVSAAADKLTVFGGAGGSYFIEEMRRGCVGTMPYGSQPSAFVEIWDRFQAGDEDGAQDVFERFILPVNRVAAEGLDTAYHVHKQLLVKQGIIRSAAVRGPASRLDGTMQGEISSVIQRVSSAAKLAQATV